MCKCKYCGKEFDNKQKLGGHTAKCKFNPNYEKNKKQLEEARKNINRENKHLHCQYCNKEIGNNGCLVLHEKYCVKNPNRILSKTQKIKESHKLKKDENGKIIGYWKNKKQSEETKQKIREGLQRWKESHKEEFLNYSRQKSKCCENFKDYLRKNNIDFIEEYCPYPKERLYCLDIAWPDEKIAIEINGSQHYDEYGNLNKASLDKQIFFENHGWKIIQIYYKWCYGIFETHKEITSILELPIHNKEYVKECFTRKYLKNKEKIDKQIEKNKLKQEEYIKRKKIIENLINNSGIDFTKSHWSTDAYNYLLSRNELFNKGIFRMIKYYFPEFLQREDVWKRKGSIF